MSEKPGPGNERWEKVERKKKRAPEERRPKLRKQARPDALLIKKGGELTFADILKKVKADNSLNNLGQKVTQIRRTMGGDLLLELKSTGEPAQTSLFRDQLKGAIGGDTEIKSLSQEATILIKDLDEATEANDVVEAVEELFPTAKGTCRVKNIKTAYGGTQTATINVPCTLAKEMIRMGKINVGWVVCRIREQFDPIRCYKCLDFGHRAASCKSGTDRSKLCMRCGNTGHVAKGCQNSHRCMICSGKDGINSNHGTGNYRCPSYQEALRRKRA